MGSSKILGTKTKSEAFLANNNNSSSLLQFVWERYKGVAKNHRLTLGVLDETLSRLLFWIPHNADIENSTSTINNDNNNTTTTTTTTTGTNEYGDAAWREVGYGILSLHRLSMDLALNDDENHHSSSTNNSSCSRTNHYGMSIRTKYPPTMAATSARICLTVLHSLMPSLISLVVLLRAKHNNAKNNLATSNNNNNNNNTSIAASASKARLVLEQAKFLLRLSLLVHYWRQQRNTTNTSTSTSESSHSNNNNNNKQQTNVYGIMLDGGLYHSDQPQESIGIPWDHAMALQRRRNYVGERTGWNNGVAAPPPTASGTATATSSAACSAVSSFSAVRDYCCSKISQRLLGDVDTGCFETTKTAFAELLYVARPLLWAWFESRYHAFPKSVNHDTDTIRQWSGAAAVPITTNNATTNNNSRGRPNLLKGWLLCLAMDVLSIRLLLEQQQQQQQQTQQQQMNHFAGAEIRRRKLRLLLYLLRSPAWSNHTLPTLEGISHNVLRRIPVLGSVMEAVIWDWVLYYQHPFVSEEG